MKKKSFIALSSALFIIAGLCGCNGESDSVVTNMLSGLRNGFKFYCSISGCKCNICSERHLDTVF